MKKIYFCLMIIFLGGCGICFCGCDTEYPKTAIYVGEGKDFESIQEAIDSSSFAGQYIILSPGTYNENITVNKSVKIFGHFSRSVINGSVLIEADGVGFENVVFDGKDEISNGIIISAGKDIEGLKFEECDIKGFTEHGLLCEQSEDETVNGITFLKCDITKNKKYGLYFENVKSVLFSDCYFEKNGIYEGENEECYAICLNYKNGDYTGVKFDECDFRRNGSGENDNSGAILVCINENASFDGEVVSNYGYFLENKRDILSQSKKNGYEPVTISNINLQSWNCDIKYKGNE